MLPNNLQGSEGRASKTKGAKTRCWLVGKTVKMAMWPEQREKRERKEIGQVLKSFAATVRH